jgi:hypothetical protein
LAGDNAALKSTGLAVVGGITSEGDEAQLVSLNHWMDSEGLPLGIVGYDFADQQSGNQKAVFDLAWPNGVQEELSQPVAVLLNEEAEVLAIASQAGFRSFTSTSEFQKYVKTEVLREAAPTT